MVVGENGARQQSGLEQHSGLLGGTRDGEQVGDDATDRFDVLALELPSPSHDATRPHEPRSRLGPPPVTLVLPEQQPRAAGGSSA